ncbi:MULTISPECIES: thioredoxin domain-containing protein [unclassified Streptomyces]|uniref:DsbA family protein n=1 Tax=unclassified Streptomyces TaxID=2593676 RepID=UPI002DDABA4F|nr:thioredoxin domain-containing protein [Streptomyces sp. NBC_01750]WSB05048.1 DsbA family protein [Streptomyces sp. NBC_01794]WSD30682.1 DsbA family protein [Streptomyces sp. NBC_01750]
MQVDRTKHRRIAVVMAAAVGLALMVAGCGTRAAQADRSDTERPIAKQTYLSELPERLEADGTTITVGNPDAPVAIGLYEDPRCPYCKEFELTGGAPEVDARAKQGKLKIQYTLASFLDDRLGGHGSRKAVNALRAALEEGKFEEYHAVLYANQPAEEVDGYTDAYLLQLASKVPGLRGERFESAVKGMRYTDFVTASQAAYERGGGPGTPTMLINGKPLPQNAAGAIYEEATTQALLDIAEIAGQYAQNGG